PALLRARRGLDRHAERRGRPPRHRPPCDRRQERPDRGGRADRRRPGRGPPSLPHLGRRRRGGRQGRSRRGVRVDLLTREYPPDVYGGAGVHVEYLARELARLEDVPVHAWGAHPPGAQPPVHAYRAWDALGGEAPHLAALRAMSIDLTMA